MSLASLQDVYHVVVIADEIESFVNVVLDQALHRIPHNFEHSDGLLAEYFDKSNVGHDGVKTCSEARVELITRGVLCIAHQYLQFFGPEGEITPLRMLFNIMFSWFRRDCYGK